MLTTSALPDAHSIPSITHESDPEPLSSSTLPTTSSAPGATPLWSAVRRRARPGDGRGDVRAVTVAVTGVLTGDERLRLRDPAGQIGMPCIDAGVEHRDRRPRPVETGRPGLRGTDLRDAVGEVDLDLVVEPQLRDAAREARRERLRRSPSGRHRRPEQLALSPARRDRGTVDAGQVALLRRARRSRAVSRCACSARTGRSAATRLRSRRRIPARSAR